LYRHRTDAGDGIGLHNTQAASGQPIFTKTVWTLRGSITYYIRFLIHLRTRRVRIAGITPNPDSFWTAQAARNMSMTFAAEPVEFRPTHIIRDRDSKFTAEFSSILEIERRVGISVSFKTP
jgi:hypothetical protein